MEIETKQYKDKQVQFHTRAGIRYLDTAAFREIVGQQVWRDLESGEAQYIALSEAIPLAMKYENEDFADWLRTEYESDAADIN